MKIVDNCFGLVYFISSLIFNSVLSSNAKRKASNGKCEKKNVNACWLCSLDPGFSNLVRIIEEW